MTFVKVCRVICCALVFGAALAAVPNTFGQESNQPARANTKKEEDVNLDTQLYLILATNRDVEDARLPSALEPVMKRLHDSLPFKHYTLPGTFLNRVRNTSRFDVSWVGGPFLVPASTATNSPSFSQFSAVVQLSTDESGREVVRLECAARAQRRRRFGCPISFSLSRLVISSCLWLRTRQAEAYRTF